MIDGLGNRFPQLVSPMPTSNTASKISNAEVGQGCSVALVDFGFRNYSWARTTSRQPAGRSRARKLESNTRPHPPLLVNGRAKVRPQALCKCELRITFHANQRDRAKQVRQALRRALNLNPFTFELTGTRKPTEPKV